MNSTERVLLLLWMLSFPRGLYLSVLRMVFWGHCQSCLDVLEQPHVLCQVERMLSSPTMDCFTWDLSDNRTEVWYLAQSFMEHISKLLFAVSFCVGLRY